MIHAGERPSYANEPVRVAARFVGKMLMVACVRGGPNQQPLTTFMRVPRRKAAAFS